MKPLVEIKSQKQAEAKAAFKANGYWGAIYMATGTGKSKIAVDLVVDLLNIVLNPRILLVVPTEKLRDVGWKEEFASWDKQIPYAHLTRCCYASLASYEGLSFDFVILDEGHNITPANSEFFKENVISACLLLTATKPTDYTKIQILKSLRLYNPIYEVPLDQAVELGLVSPFEITVVHMELDNTSKYLESFVKDKVLVETEKERYDRLTRSVHFSPNPLARITRMAFIRGLKSKTEAAKLMLRHVIPDELRTLIFCGSKDQADELCTNRFYSPPSKPKLSGKPNPTKLAALQIKMDKYTIQVANYKKDISLKAFIEGYISQLACVEALNEGHNIPGLDVGFMVQVNSKELDLVQRIGRIIRQREGHVGKIIILCVDNTVDKEWVDKCLFNINPDSIKHITLQELRTQTKFITF